MLTEFQKRLCGLDGSHLQECRSHYLHPQAASAFLAMQNQALLDGIQLEIASGFRDYHRQAAIWQRKVSLLSQQKADSKLENDIGLHQILRWSAMPGASRHHWGSDMDVYDPLALQGEKLKLEPWEYQDGGHQNELYMWLKANAPQFGFFWPYAEDFGGVAIEPWHLSYAPISNQLNTALDHATLCEVWQNYPPAEHQWLKKNCSALLQRYVHNIQTSA